MLKYQNKCVRLKNIVKHSNYITFQGLIYMCKPVATTFCTLSLNGHKMLFIYLQAIWPCQLCHSHIRLGMSMVSSPGLLQDVLGCVGGESWHLGPQSFIRYSKYFGDFNCLAGS